MENLCDMKKKEIEDQIYEIMKRVNEPKFICKKCARAANDKELLCKPIKIKVTDRNK